MYSTCLHCARSLGRNAMLETLPIGRRLAFDATQGRLWVVCRWCAKWNLVPFDNRLETIDAAERLFRDTPTRYSTEHIGLAKVGEGLELVCIGSAERREFAAWRYNRFRGSMAIPVPVFHALLGAGAGNLVQAALATGTGTVASAVSASASLVPIVVMLGLAWRGLRRRVPTVTDANGDRRDLRLVDVPNLWYHRGHDGDPWRLTGLLQPMTARSPLARATVEFQVQGKEAQRLLALVVEVGLAPGREGGAVDRAIGLIEDRTKMEALLAAPDRFFPSWYTGKRPVGLGVVPREVRLAMLMASQETREREWLEGELALLEREWRDADRLAKISDGLALDADQP